MKDILYLTESRILLAVEETDKADVLRYMTRHLAHTTGLRNPLALEYEILERELLGTTSIGHGVAFPHTRSAQVTSFVTLLARPAKPLVYGAIDGQPVNILFMLVAPYDCDSVEYINVMARISRLMRRQEVRSAILAAATPYDVLARLQKP